MSRSLRSRTKVGEEKILEDETKKSAAGKKTTTKTSAAPVAPGKYVRVVKAKNTAKVTRVLRPRSKTNEEKNPDEEKKKPVVKKNPNEDKKKTVPEKTTTTTTREKSVRVKKLKPDDQTKKLTIKKHGVSPSPPALRDRTNLKAPRSKKTEASPTKTKQTTLQESFAKGKKKSPVKPADTKKKIQAPVYKTVEKINTEKTISDEDKLYDFEQYYSPSQEETGKKKRKRNTTKNPPAKKLKTSVAESKIPRWKMDSKQTKHTISKIIPSVKIDKVPSKTTEKSDVLKAIEDFHRIPSTKDPVSIKPSNKQVVAQIHDNPPENYDFDDDNGGGMSFEEPEVQDDTVDQQSMAVEEDKSPEKLTATKKLAVTPVPFRKNNVLDVKSSEANETMNDTLIGQGLSPIPRCNQTNFGEKRPCVTTLEQPTFSRIKNVVQSTPQSKILTEKKIKEIKPTVTMKKIDENFNSSRRKNNSNSSKSPRKFGTELLNMSGSSESSAVLGTTITTTMIEKEIDKNVVASTILPIVTADSPEVSLEENSENKENVNKSPKKSPSKKNRLLLDSPRRSFGKPSWSKAISSGKLLKNVSSSYDEEHNINPQPGPSGSEEKRQPLTERRVIGQSNLSILLDPEVTTGHESPVKEKNNGNLFGFEDDIHSDSDDGLVENSSTSSSRPKYIVPIKKLIKPKIVTDEKLQRPTRLSAGRINKLLKNDKSKEAEKKNEQPKMDQIEAIKAHFGTTKAAVVEAKSFSDTFDIMSEEQKLSEIADVPLFVDLEPVVHFNQPARYSYNRKRPLTYETDDEENKNTYDSDDGARKTRAKPTKKKRRINKEEREQQKKLEEWAKNLSATFGQIDEHEMVVE